MDAVMQGQLKKSGNGLIMCWGDKNQLVSSGQNSIYYHKCDLTLCAIFLTLTKYSYLHNHSIKICTIFIILRIFPGLISNNYVNSSL